MDTTDKLDILLGVLYISGALSLVVVAYLIMIKRYRRAKMEAMNSISLITSRENVFKKKTQFLIICPESCEVKIDLLDENEQYIKTLVEEEIFEEEHPFDFDPVDYDSGKYYISLKTESAKILRAITIVK